MTSSIFVFALCLASAASVAAQPAETGRPAPEQMRARYQMRVMEQVLAEAVQLGARLTGVQIPSLVLVAAPARARGFRLDGYGLFFDVEVPPLKGSMAWSIRTLGQHDAEMRRALQQLRRHVQSLGDARDRRTLEQAVRRIEVQVAPGEEGVAGVPPLGPLSGAVLSQAQPEPPVAPPPPPAAPTDDPGKAYTAAVRGALVDAMLDYGGGVPIGDDEWLTVGAREIDSFGGSELYDSITLTLRIRGADLHALRAGRLTRDEARQRVFVREF